MGELFVLPYFLVYIYVGLIDKVGEERCMDVLVVVDMQNDFIDGALGTEEAVNILPRVVKKIKGFNGKVFFKRDTHDENYLLTQEGKKLNVVHCIKNTNGWQLNPQIQELVIEEVFDKPTFGSIELCERLYELHKIDNIKTITIIGLCTDICVISNAMILKAFFPESEIIVDASCCAGVTPSTHKQALESMKMCHIDVINE